MSSSRGTSQPHDAGGVDHSLDGFFTGVDFAKPKTQDFSGITVDETVYVHEGKTLYTMNPTSFTVTKVGDFGVDSNAQNQMTDLAVLPDGRIYTVSRIDLYQVNPTTAVATKIMPNISSDTNGSNVAMTTLPDGTLLVADQSGTVRVIDPVGMTVTTLGTYGQGWDTAGDLVSVADGTMYGVAAKGPGTRTDANALITVDTSTAAGTLVGTIEDSAGTGYVGVFGIAYSQGRVIAFTKTGQILQIDPATGKATLVMTLSDKVFFGAGSNPLISPIG